MSAMRSLIKDLRLDEASSQENTQSSSPHPGHDRAIPDDPHVEVQLDVPRSQRSCSVLEWNNGPSAVGSDSSLDVATLVQSSVPRSPPQPESEVLPCGLQVDSHDREAIFLYRTWFASTVDIKHPAYSVPAIVLQMVTSQAAGMHVVLAIGRQLIKRGPWVGVWNVEPGRQGHHVVVAMEHYGQALRLIGDTMLRRDSGPDLDTALATLWLMIVYEQRFGEKPVEAVKAHLHGVVSILSTANLAEMLRMSRRVLRESAARGAPESPEAQSGLSCLVARLLIWLLGLDARAATFGPGGLLNKAVAELLGIAQHGEAVDEWFNTLSLVYERSAPLFRLTWGPEYPAKEILYDMKHREIFDLFRKCAQVRLMVAEIRQATGTEARQDKIVAAQTKLRDLEKEHIDLLNVAKAMPDSSSELGEDLAITLCWVIPHYQACVLDLIQACNGRNTEDDQGAIAAREILKPAIYGYHKQGTASVVRVAWPLFMAGLETKDLIQQDWIVDRLKELGSSGRSYRKAAELLEATIRLRRAKATQGIEDTAGVIESISSGAFFI